MQQIKIPLKKDMQRTSKKWMWLHKGLLKKSEVNKWTLEMENRGGSYTRTFSKLLLAGKKRELKAMMS